MKLAAYLAMGASLMVVSCATMPAMPEMTEEFVLPEGVTLVETVERQGDEILIPYSKYELDNGLTVILHEDDSDPLVHVDVTYHVGSAREDVGKSGFAHFFEHMMFQGSENVADEQHFGLITESGGTLNGSTNTDRTNYYQTIPANQLERILWLEADRMGYFLDAVTMEKFENQRETVKNERGQNYDNRPYGLLREKVAEAMYPEGHPYSWLTIGYIEDLNRANLSDLKKFFLRWYGPNNATLTIGGDLDKEQTLEWVIKYFGSIPEGPAVDDPDPMTVTLSEDRYISYEDNVSLPLVYMAWPTTYARSEDEAPLDVLMSILGDGRTSLFYKNMVKDGKAVQASAGHPCGELACQFTLYALPNPASGTSLSDLEGIIRDTLVEFEQRGVEEDDLTRVKADIVSNMIYGLESVSGKVSQLAAYETFEQEPNYITQDIARYESVTAEDVMRVYETYIKDKPAVILSIVPEGQTDAVAQPDNWTFAGRTIPEAEVITDADLDFRRATDDFDRSVIPPSGPNPVITVPPTWEGELANGIDVLGAVNDEVPTTSISIRIRTGQVDESLDKLGLASLTAAMLNEATTESTSEDLDNRLAKLGSSVSIYGDDLYTTVNIRSLTENLDETLDIAAEKLFSPAFAPEDFTRVQDQTIEGIKQSNKDAATVASNVFNLLLYGKDNTFAYSDSGTESTVAALTLDDVKGFYNETYNAGSASVVVVSSLGEDEVMDKLDVFSSWTGDANPDPVVADFPEIEAGTLFFVHKPDAPQSQIIIGKRALPYDATGEYYKAGLMNYALGGAFNSRINLNLREDKGYTYGARSRFYGSELFQEFYARAGVRADSTTDSVRQFVNELDSYNADGISAQELAFTKSAIGQRDARSYETPGQKRGFLSQMMTYDLSPSFVDEQNMILSDITKEELDALAAEHLNTEDMIIVVVGDQETVLNDLYTLGYPIVIMDEDANMIGY